MKNVILGKRCRIERELPRNFLRGKLQASKVRVMVLIITISKQWGRVSE